MEVWADIPRYQGYYQASNLGRIRRCKAGGKGSVFGKILSPGQQTNGYLIVILSVGGKVKTERVHRLVAEAFLGYCQSGMEVCHNNGNQHDNRSENLRWDTRKANVADTVRQRRHIFGERHCFAKLAEKDAILILNDNRLHKEIAEEFGISRQLVGYIKTGKKWRHIQMNHNPIDVVH